MACRYQRRSSEEVFFSERSLLGSWFMSQGSRQKFVCPFEKVRNSRPFRHKPSRGPWGNLTRKLCWAYRPTMWASHSLQETRFWLWEGRPGPSETPSETLPGIFFFWLFEPGRVLTPLPGGRGRNEKTNQSLSQKWRLSRVVPWKCPFGTVEKKTSPGHIRCREDVKCTELIQNHMQT